MRSGQVIPAFGFLKIGTKTGNYATINHNPMNKNVHVTRYTLIPQGNRAIVCEGNIRLALIDGLKLNTHAQGHGHKLPEDEDIQWALKNALVARYRVFHKPMSSRDLEAAAALDD